MAGLKIEADFNFKSISDLIKIFPSLNGRFLALVGKRARMKLKQDYLSGQELNFRIPVEGSATKRKITSDVNKRQDAVKIYSFPVNLFEKGRMLRSGKKEKGKYIITRKLKQDIMAGMAGYINEWENRIVQDEINKLGLN